MPTTTRQLQPAKSPCRRKQYRIANEAMRAHYRKRRRRKKKDAAGLDGRGGGSSSISSGSLLRFLFSVAVVVFRCRCCGCENGAVVAANTAKASTSATTAFLIGDNYDRGTTANTKQWRRRRRRRRRGEATAPPLPISSSPLPSKRLAASVARQQHQQKQRDGDDGGDGNGTLLSGNDDDNRARATATTAAAVGSENNIANGDGGGRFSYVESYGDYRRDARLLEEEGADSPLYRHQSSLPRLPVPSLKDTAKAFLPTALPLLASSSPSADDDEAALSTSLEEACRSFPQQAAALQERLWRRAGRFDDSSWLQLWWNQEVYLNCRDPLFHVSYYYRFEDGIGDDKSDGGAEGVGIDRGLRRAAAAVQAAALYALDVHSQTLKADMVGSRGTTPLCSVQYKYLFNSCRIPRRGQDSYRVYRPPRQNGQPQHVVVACKGQFYKVPVENAVDGSVLSREALESALEECARRACRQEERPTDDEGCDNFVRVPKLGYLTTTDRDTWADNYEFLCRSCGPLMREALEELQSGIGVLALDIDGSDGGPSDPHMSDTEHARQLWHGDHVHSANRWLDKSFNIVVSWGGQWGYIGEHSMMDGLPSIALCCEMMDAGKARNGDPPGVSGTDEVPKVVPIFEKAFVGMDARTRAEIAALVDEARSDLTERINRHDCRVLTYKKYGCTEVKQTGLLPDAFAQIAMQVAAFRVFGKTVGTYEATQTRKFLHGRTETTRTVSPESQAFVNAMCIEPDSHSIEDKIALLRTAVNVHSHTTRKALIGRGVDRHFFGLSMSLQEGEKVPDLFSHPLFLESKRWRISTSNVPRSRCGFANVVEDGLGIGYDIQPDELIFSVHGLAETGYVERMVHFLESALDEMQDLLNR